MSTLRANAVQTVTGKPILNSTGSILQVVQFLDLGVTPGGAYVGGSNLLTSSTTTFQNIMSRAITTTADNSRILVEVICVGYTSSGVLRARSYLTRNGTVIDGDPYAWYSDTQTMTIHTIKNLDSPNVPAGTTLTYVLQGSYTSGGTAQLGYQDSGGGAHNSITLTEISA